MCRSTPSRTAASSRRTSTASRVSTVRSTPWPLKPTWPSTRTVPPAPSVASSFSPSAPLASTSVARLRFVRIVPASRFWYMPSASRMPPVMRGLEMSPETPRSIAASPVTTFPAAGTSAHRSPISPFHWTRAETGPRWPSAGSPPLARTGRAASMTSGSPKLPVTLASTSARRPSQATEASSPRTPAPEMSAKTISRPATWMSASARPGRVSKSAATRSAPDSIGASKSRARTERSGMSSRMSPEAGPP